LSERAEDCPTARDLVLGHDAPTKMALIGFLQALNGV
jgi:hypothetical protein